MKEEYPYKECEKCQTLDDCPYPEVDLDGLGSPLPPANCPKPIEVMKRTTKKHKLQRKESQN